jgi:hypothetical protein
MWGTQIFIEIDVCVWQMSVANIYGGDMCMCLMSMANIYADVYTEIDMCVIDGDVSNIYVGDIYVHDGSNVEHIYIYEVTYMHMMDPM